MKKVCFILLFTAFIHTTFSQSITASGIVKNEDGNAVSAALVSEYKSNPAAATYTDSLGSFNFAIKRYSKLVISCKGYNDTLININDKKAVLVILTKAKSVKSSTDAAVHNPDDQLINKNSIQDAVSTQSGIHNNYVYGAGTRNYTGSLLPVFSHKEETKGSRYLFNEWVHGSVVNTDNSVFNNPAYLYNYDKMEGGLLLTQDKQSAIEADKAQIKTFTIYVDKDNPLVYESVPAIDANHYVQVISSGNNYKIYKLTKTKFVKSNYHTDGIAETGNPYDEYVDEDSYFSINVRDNKMLKVSLKKKSLKETYASEGKKLDKFLSENSDQAINDVYMKNLGDYLNN